MAEVLEEPAEQRKPLVITQKRRGQGGPPRRGLLLHLLARHLRKRLIHQGNGLASAQIAACVA